MTFMRCTLLAFAFLSYVSPVRAALIFDVDIKASPGVFHPKDIIPITLTLSNSSASTQNLGVLFSGVSFQQPNFDPVLDTLPGFDFDVGGFASTPPEYQLDLNDFIAFQSNFTGVDLAPGASFSFTQPLLMPRGNQAVPDGAYSWVYQFQLFDNTAARNAISFVSAVANWTVRARKPHVSVPEPSNLAVFAIGLATLAFMGWRRRFMC